MSELKLSEKTQYNSVQSTVFSDGMVVNSEDLNTAMMYPMNLMRVFMQAYFGCGVVCGLDLRLMRREEGERNFCIKVLPGVALDCLGNPIQLCEEEILNLQPESCDPCNPLDYRNLPTEVFIAVKRTTKLEAPRNDGSDCDNQGKPLCNYSRAREATTIRAFTSEELKNLCLCKFDKQSSRASSAADASDRNDLSHCNCLTDCGECHCCECCDESWVLLGSVKVTDEGLKDLDKSVRRFVKPTECFCGSGLRKQMTESTGNTNRAPGTKDSRPQPATGTPAQTGIPQGDPTQTAIDKGTGIPYDPNIIVNLPKDQLVAKKLLEEKLIEEQELEKRLLEVKLYREELIKKELLEKERLQLEILEREKIEKNPPIESIPTETPTKKVPVRKTPTGKTPPVEVPDKTSVPKTPVTKTPTSKTPTNKTRKPPAKKS